MLRTMCVIEAVQPDGEERGYDALAMEAAEAIKRLLEARHNGGGQYRMTFEWLSEEDMTKSA